MGESKPVIGITVGDPAGIGPEIVLKALGDPTIDEVCRPILIGDLGNLRWTNEQLGLGQDLVAHPDGVSEAGRIGVIDQSNIDGSVEFGIENAKTGRSAAGNIEASVKLWREGVIDAVSTAPISKNALKLAGYEYPGHTEFFASLTNTKEFAMSFLRKDSE